MDDLVCRFWPKLTPVHYLNAPQPTDDAASWREHHADPRDSSTYHFPTIFQLKTMLYHAGILTERGAAPATLEPRADEWQLRKPISKRQ
jgi:hypothetical protein